MNLYSGLFGVLKLDCSVCEGEVVKTENPKSCASVELRHEPNDVANRGLRIPELVYSDEGPSGHFGRQEWCTTEPESSLTLAYDVGFGTMR